LEAKLYFKKYTSISFLRLSRMALRTSSLTTSFSLLANHFVKSVW
jgi:hypothetical protein